jgi:indole-3-glycerol phosphate synthase
MSILHEIFAHKRAEVAAAKTRLSMTMLEARLGKAPQPLDMLSALTGRSHAPPKLIAEVKHRSPSKGVLCPDFDPLRLARSYAEHGAAAISVLTDKKYFGGSLRYLREIAALDLGLPLLRKDFIFDVYQLLEARVAGASAVLLIVAMLEDLQLRSLLGATRELGMEALVETHDRDEIEKALDAGARLIGINNRNLHTFEVSLETTLELCPEIPPDIVVVAESGIHTPGDVSRLKAAHVNSMLIGESLVTADDIGAKIKSLLRDTHQNVFAK